MTAPAQILVEQAIVDMLANAKDHYQPDCDEARADAFARIAASEAPAHIGTRPQVSGNIGITVDSVGGDIFHATNVQIGCSRPTIDIHVWYKDETNRKYHADALSLIRYIELAFRGLSRKVGNVEIQTIQVENDIIHDEFPPIDASDNWTARYTLSIAVVYQKALPTTFKGD